MLESVQRFNRKPVRRTCDVCKREVNPNDWFSIETLHGDWGNDSCESFEWFDACSPDCAAEFTKKYLNGAFAKKVRNTMRIEIEHRNGLD